MPIVKERQFNGWFMDAAIQGGGVILEPWKIEWTPPDPAAWRTWRQHMPGLGATIPEWPGFILQRHRLIKRINPRAVLAYAIYVQPRAIFDSRRGFTRIDTAPETINRRIYRFVTGVGYVHTNDPVIRPVLNRLEVRTGTGGATVIAQIAQANASHMGKIASLDGNYYVFLGGVGRVEQDSVRVEYRFRTDGWVQGIPIGTAPYNPQVAVPTLPPLHTYYYDENPFSPAIVAVPPGGRWLEFTPAGTLPLWT